MIRSLRMRLFLGVTAVSAVVLAGLGFAIEEAVRHTLKGEFDRAMLENARALASMVEQTGDVPRFDYQRAQFPEYEPGSASAYFEIYLDGSSFRRSDSLGESHLPMTSDEAGPHGFRLPDGRRGRILLIPFSPLVDDDGQPPPFHRAQHTGVLVVARDSADLDRTVSRLVALTVGLCGIATLLSGAALIGVAARALRPLGRLAREIESVRETDLSTALDSKSFPPELVPVVDRLNELLGRLDEVFARERGFTADVAHELRTPLAGLLTTLEVARSRRRDAAAYEGAIDKSLAILGQMQGLVENLLLLARADSGQLKVRHDAVDVEALLQECRMSFERAAGERQLQFAISGEGEGRGDSGFLRVIFNNLLDNAVSYATAGSTIEISIAARGGRMIVEISNEGHALEAGDLPRLFERFARKDVARAATGIHAGLGLSICRRLTELQEARVEIRLAGTRFVARVELPLTVRESQRL